MRLWHYKLIPFLPNSQLLAQWRELNSIFKKQDNHILINYVYEYPKEHLFAYSLEVISEMQRRNILVKAWGNFDAYFNEFRSQYLVNHKQIEKPFPEHHNDRYLLQCFYNLQEKYDRGQKDFDTQRYAELEHFILIQEQKSLRG